MASSECNFEFGVIKKETYTKTKQKPIKVQGDLLPLSDRKDKSRLVLGSANIYWASNHGLDTGQENPQHVSTCVKYPHRMHSTYAYTDTHLIRLCCAIWS